MVDPKSLADLIEFAGANIVENLAHIPSDKFNWKPAPQAKSVQEIVAHILGNFAQFSSQSESAAPEVSDIETARTLLREATQNYAAHLRQATPEQLAVTRDLGAMTLPASMLATIGAIDLINHHGQITYIQTLLGDEESHFDMQAFGKLM